MIRINNLTWGHDPNTGNPIAYYSADMSVDTEYEFYLYSNFLNRDIHANVITVDNMINDNNVQLYIGNAFYTVLARSRRTFSIPYSVATARAVGVLTGGIVTFIFQVEFSSQGDDTDFYGIQQSAGNALKILTVNKNNIDQTGIPNSTFVKLTFNTPVIDTIGSSFDFVNSRFIPQEAGWYLLILKFRFTLVNIVDQEQYIGTLAKNGVTAAGGVGSTTLRASGVGNTEIIPVITVTNMNGSTDYIECYCWGGGAGDKTVTGLNAVTQFNAIKIA